MAASFSLEKIFTPSGEAGVDLEIVTATPRGDGPFPTLIFNHGSTGRGHNKAVWKRTISPAVIAEHFAVRGWMTLFPQRRGRGKSGGDYGEGLSPDGSGYSCDPELALSGFGRAVADIEAVLHGLQRMARVDRDRLLIGGVSRGGILAIACAGLIRGRFRGAINFNGGWLGRACPAYESVNPELFLRGAKAGIPTIWLHGSRDPYYPISHCRDNFARYQVAGGQGRFVSVAAGHALMFRPALWRPSVDAWMSELFAG